MPNWKIFAIDPSGDYSDKGKGHTGTVLLEYDKENKAITNIVPKTIKAKNYNSKKEYYDAIIKKIKKVDYDFLVVENYRTVEKNATTETSELIGIIEYIEPKLIKQWNHEIKNVRFSESNLINRNMLFKEKSRRYIVFGKKIDGHGRDALKHALKFICKNTMHALKEMEVLWDKNKKNS